MEQVNKVLPIGGPGRAYTPLDQANVLFRVAGVAPSYVRVPIEIMDGVIALLDKLGSVFPQLEDAAEFGRIGRYYAAESMLVYDPVTGQYDADATPSYGKDTLQAVFTKLVKEGMKGQELGALSLLHSDRFVCLTDVTVDEQLLDMFITHCVLLVHLYFTLCLLQATPRCSVSRPTRDWFMVCMRREFQRSPGPASSFRHIITQ